MEKKEFVETKLRDVVMASDTDITNVSYEVSDYEEYVHLHYGEHIKTVAVTADSCIAIIRDVARKL